MRLQMLSAIVGAAALSFVAAGAQALPAPEALDTGVSGNRVENVQYRYSPHRHYRPYYGYRYRPSYFRHPPSPAVLLPASASSAVLLTGARGGKLRGSCLGRSGA